MTDLSTKIPLFSAGIDPGIKNLGFALVKETQTPFKFEIVKAKTLDPSACFGEAFTQMMINTLCDEAPISRIHALTMERFVPYNNVWSDIAEEVNHLIGMLRICWYMKKGEQSNLVRAIDWKTTLVKKLARHVQFDNPSKKGLLDKTFSIAAAKALVVNPELIKTDHEADAICLAAYPLVLREVDRILKPIHPTPPST